MVYDQFSTKISTMVAKNQLKVIKGGIFSGTKLFLDDWYPNKSAHHFTLTCLLDLKNDCFHWTREILRMWLGGEVSDLTWLDATHVEITSSSPSPLFFHSNADFGFQLKDTLKLISVLNHGASFNTCWLKSHFFHLWKKPC